MKAFAFDINAHLHIQEFKNEQMEAVGRKRSPNICHIGSLSTLTVAV